MIDGSSMTGMNEIYSHFYYNRGKLALGFVFCYTEEKRKGDFCEKAFVVCFIGVGIAVAALLYVVLALVFRAVEEEDIRILPKGEKLLALFRKLRLVK